MLGVIVPFRNSLVEVLQRRTTKVSLSVAGTEEGAWGQQMWVGRRGQMYKASLPEIEPPPYQLVDGELLKCIKRHLERVLKNLLAGGHNRNLNAGIKGPHVAHVAFPVL